LTQGVSLEFKLPDLHVAQFLDSMSQSLKEKLGALMSSSAGSATT